MDKHSYIGNVHLNYLESLYQDYQKDPSSIDPEWRKFFEGFDFGLSQGEGEEQLSPKEFKVWNLIEAYRHKAHLISKTNPIRERKDRHANLKLNDLGLSEEDLDQEFFAGKSLGLGKTTLRNILDHLDKIYCRSIGFEYMHVIEKDELEWLQKNIEKETLEINFPIEKKKHILKKLNETVVFEKFLNTKYIGQKRFSLEGGETTIPALDHIINTCAQNGMKEAVIGMAHRGRLNVLANLLGKTYEQIFSEFEGDINPDLTMGDGDVKYHVGFNSKVNTPSGKEVNIKLAPNPSHLEAVTPVVQGYARAKADNKYNDDYNKILPILIHGDAALTGQGVVYEVTQMSQLEGYKTGGTIHFVTPPALPQVSTPLLFMSMGMM